MAVQYALELENVDKVYGTGETAVTALNHVNLAVRQGEFISLVGESGSGKSTLFNVVGMLDAPTAGSIRIDGKEQGRMTPDQQAIFRRENIGFIFQSFHLIQELTVEENIVFPLLLGRRGPDREKIDRLIQKLGLENRRNHFPSQLSGGQQQRTAIGRALATEPKLILADEPTGNLDSKNSREVVRLLWEMAKEYGKTVLLITHNRDIAAMADRSFMVKDGCVYENREADEPVLESHS